MYINNFENVNNLDILNNEFNNEFDNDISFVRKCLSYFFMVLFFSNMLRVLQYYFDIEPFAIYLRNDVYQFIINLQSGLSSKLLKYNGHFADFDPSSFSDIVSDTDYSSDDSSSSLDSPLVEVKYEDKYLDDIKKMCLDYRFSWAELPLIENKFNELFDLYKTNLINDLEKEIVEKSMKYLDMDDEDDYENIGFLEKEKKDIEEEIILLRSTVTELKDKVKDDFDLDVIANLDLEARQFVIKQRLDSLKNNFVFEKTPLGNVIMYWNNSRESFEFYSDNSIPYRYLETVARKYVKTFNCRQIYVDMEFELSEFERKQKEKQDLEEFKLLEEKKKMEELEQNTSFNSTSNSNLGKKDVFAKFKNYNKESGTGKVNRGAAPPKNSIPNNNVKTVDEKVILKENANRYTCEGKIANFSFLKKPDRKIIDKKYAMSFADYKKLNL